MLPFTLKLAQANVIINELAWMGTPNSGNDEWLELYNNGVQNVELSGWLLAAADGTPKVQLQGTVPGLAFYLLERTDDTTINTILADLIYTGALANSGEDLILSDNNGQIQDRLAATTGWPAGDNQLKYTLERGVSGQWQSSAASGGTPKSANSAALAPLVLTTQPNSAVQTSAANTSEEALSAPTEQPSATAQILPEHNVLTATAKAELVASIPVTARPWWFLFLALFCGLLAGLIAFFWYKNKATI